MNNERRLLSVDHFDRDPYTSSQARERDLNTAIVEAEINQSFEQYLEIFDEFYGDDTVQVWHILSLSFIVGLGQSFGLN